MNVSRVLKPVALLAVGAVVGAVTLMTYSGGRGQCPKCGYLHDLYTCRECGWTACLGCWQKYSQHGTCPGCGCAHP